MESHPENVRRSHLRNGDASRWLLLMTMLLPLSALAQGSGQAPVEPGSPQIQDVDVRSLSEDKPMQPWKPGDPVRVMGDLKEDGQEGSDGNEKKPKDGISKPIVRQPVAPKVMDKDVDELDKVKPYKPGDPVRVVPDLREDDSKK